MCEILYIISFFWYNCKTKLPIGEVVLQTRLESFLESFTNIMIGYIVALISQLIIFPFFDIKVTFTDNLLIGFYFTVISLIRSYTVRRFYNNRVKRSNKI